MFSLDTTNYLVHTSKRRHVAQIDEKNEVAIDENVNFEEEFQRLLLESLNASYNDPTAKNSKPSVFVKFLPGPGEDPCIVASVKLSFIIYRR